MSSTAQASRGERLLIAQRSASQLLTGSSATSVTQVVERLLAVQAQDPRGFRLALRPRCPRSTIADVHRALTIDRTIIVTWLNRGTLHLVRSEDYWWLHDLTTPQLAKSNARRLAQEGVTPGDAERGVGVIVDALESHGPLTRDRLRKLLEMAGVPVAGQALVHLLFLASIRGFVVRGPMLGHDQAFVSVRDWLGEVPVALEREQALSQLARRYLAGHAPATAPDLAKWAGITLTDARAGFDSLTSELIDVGAGNVALIDSLREGVEIPAPVLLGAFDPLLLGWASRDLVLPVDGGVVTNNGVFRPLALVDGQGVATWTFPNGRVVLGAAFRPLPDAARRLLDADAKDVQRFLDVAPG